MMTLTSWQNKYSSSVVNMNGILRYFTNNRPTNPNSSDLSVSLFACLSACRGVGCIFYEMVTGRPLFPGSTVEEELHFIFKLLGENQSVNRYLMCLMCFARVWCVFCVQVHPQSTAGQGSLQMTSLWRTTILSTEQRDWVTTLPGTRLCYTLVQSQLKTTETNRQTNTV